MRTALWLLALFGVAAAVALFAGNNPGSVTLFWPPYRIDLSLNFVLLLATLAFLTLHLALRALAAFLALPHQARVWRLRQRERSLQVDLLDAYSQLAAGRFVRANKSADSVLVQLAAIETGGESLVYAPRLRAVSHLIAAEAAHALQDHVLREQHYRQALAQALLVARAGTMDMADLQRWAKQEGRHDAFAEFLSLIEAHNNGEK